MKAHYLRFVALALSSLLLVGGYYSYDNPAYLNIRLQQWLGSDDETFQFQLAALYSVYSIPNIFLPMLGGFLIDRVGSRKLIILLSFLICCGQACFALSTQKRNFPGMLVGRVILGIGVESLGVAQTTFITTWFRGSECAFAIGFNLCVARLGNVLNDNFTPMIASKAGVPASLWVSFLLCFSSFICACLAVMMDGCGVSRTRKATSSFSRIEPNDAKKMNQRKTISQSTHSVSSYKSSAGSVSVTSPLLGGRRMPVPSIKGSRSEVTVQVTDEAEPHADSTINQENQAAFYSTCNRSSISISSKTSVNAEKAVADDTISLGDIWLFRLPFWCMCACMICFYGSTMPFTNIAAQVLETKWGLEGEEAGRLMGITDTLSAVTLPLFGFLVDNYGNRASLLVTTGFLIASIHIIVGFIPQVPVIVPLVILGFCYGMFASAFWSSISLLVPEHTTATAYGIATGALNGALSLVPLLVAYFVGLDQRTFQAVEAFFASLVGVGIIFAIWIGRLDRAQGSLLQLPEKSISRGSISGSTSTFETPAVSDDGRPGSDQEQGAANGQKAKVDQNETESTCLLSNNADAENSTYGSYK